MQSSKNKNKNGLIIASLILVVLIGLLIYKTPAAGVERTGTPRTSPAVDSPSAQQSPGINKLDIPTGVLDGLILQ